MLIYVIFYFKWGLWTNTGGAPHRKLKKRHGTRPSPVPWFSISWKCVNQKRSWTVWILGLQWGPKPQSWTVPWILPVGLSTHLRRPEEKSKATILKRLFQCQHPCEMTESIWLGDVSKWGAPFLKTYPFHDKGQIQMSTQSMKINTEQPSSPQFPTAIQRPSQYFSKSWMQFGELWCHKRFLTVLISPAAMYLHDSMTAKGGQIHFDNQGLSKHIIMMWIKFLNSSEFLNPRPFGQILGDDQMPIDLGSPGHSLSRLIETVHHMAGGLFPSVNQASAKKGNLVFHTLRSCPQKGRPANKMLREEIF